MSAEPFRKRRLPAAEDSDLPCHLRLNVWTCERGIPSGPLSLVLPKNTEFPRVDKEAIVSALGCNGTDNAVAIAVTAPAKDESPESSRVQLLKYVIGILRSKGRNVYLVVSSNTGPESYAHYGADDVFVVQQSINELMAWHTILQQQSPELVKIATVVLGIQEPADLPSSDAYMEFLNWFGMQRLLRGTLPFTQHKVPTFVLLDAHVFWERFKTCVKEPGARPTQLTDGFMAFMARCVDDELCACDVYHEITRMMSRLSGSK